MAGSFIADRSFRRNKISRNWTHAICCHVPKTKRPEWNEVMLDYFHDDAVEYTKDHNEDEILFRPDTIGVTPEEDEHQE